MVSSCEASYLSAASATPVALRVALRVAARANGVVCRVRGSQSDGRRALLLAERGEGTPGTAREKEAGTAGGGRAEGERGRVLGVAYERARPARDSGGEIYTGWLLGRAHFLLARDEYPPRVARERDERVREGYRGNSVIS